MVKLKVRYLQHDSHAPQLTSDILNILCGFFTTGVIFELLSHTTWFPTFYSRALSLEVAGQDKTVDQHFVKHLLSCTSCSRPLRTAPPHALGTQHPGMEAGVVAGAQHLQKVTAPKRVRGETTARTGMSQAGFSLAGLNTPGREDAKQVIAWMQDMIPGRQLLSEPMASRLHCNWHLINATSDMQSSLISVLASPKTKVMGKTSPMNPAWFSFTTGNGRSSFCTAGGLQSALTSTVKYDNNLSSKSNIFQQKDHRGVKH